MDENECMICLEEMEDNIAVLSCGHKYHFECITAWANKKKDMYKICTVCPQNNEIINIISTKTKSNSVSQIKKKIHTMLHKLKQMKYNLDNVQSLKTF